ncbi:MAG: ferrichrome ABC transporter substrate-binding protein [Erysipelotrichaceae bacterium]|nr:ferrichrome ABC transporter substrate-binding protein [Erysipelotrichaceae bacterium]
MRQSIKKGCIVLSILSLFVMGGCNKEEAQPEKIEIKQNSLYEAPKNPTNEQAKVYNELTDAIAQKAEDSKLAELVALNFVYDFFTMSNKESKEDVGGMSYIPSSMKEEFKNFAKAYFYENYDTIVNLYGKEDLPKVIMHEVNQVEEEKITYNKQTYNGYSVTLTLKYQNTSFGAEALKTNMKVKVIKEQNSWKVKALE